METGSEEGRLKHQKRIENTSRDPDEINMLGRFNQVGTGRCLSIAGATMHCASYPLLPASGVIWGSHGSAGAFAGAVPNGSENKREGTLTYLIVALAILTVLPTILKLPSMFASSGSLESFWVLFICLSHPFSLTITRCHHPSHATGPVKLERVFRSRSLCEPRG